MRLSNMYDVQHHRFCDFHTDHIPSECVCGATRPKAPWFDAFVQRAEQQEAWPWQITGPVKQRLPQP